MAKRYYAVATTVYNDGRLTMNLVDVVEAEQKPESGFKSTNRCDFYIDWFESEADAIEYINS